jgi:hypothetical protein
MSDKQHPHQPIDPGLQRRLLELRQVPARDPQMVAKSEGRFVAEVDELLHGKGFSSADRATKRAPTRKSGPIITIQQWKEKWKMATPKFRMAMTLTAVLIAMVVFMSGGAGMTAYANQNALPGDTLYGIKTGFEQTRLSLARDAADKARLNLDFAERRLDEIARLIESGRYQNIELAVQEYEKYVQSAIASLETVAAGDPSSLPELATLVADSLKRYAATLSGMTGALPEAARSEVERAIQVSFSSGGFKDEIEFSGPVEGITAEYWMVAGRTLWLMPATEIKGAIEVGEQVKVHAFLDTDGNWILREVELAFGDDDGSKDGDEIEFRGPVEGITAEYWVVAGRTLWLMPATEIKGSIEVGEQVKVHAFLDMDGKWILREVELAFDDDDGDDDRSDDDQSSEDDRHKLEFSGVVEGISTESWTIDGMLLVIVPSSEIKGAIMAGDLVKVEAYQDDGGSWILHEVELSSGDGDDDRSDDDMSDGDDDGEDDSDDDGEDDSDDDGDDDRSDDDDDDDDD